MKANEELLNNIFSSYSKVQKSSTLINENYNLFFLDITCIKCINILNEISELPVEFMSDIYVFINCTHSELVHLKKIYQFNSNIENFICDSESLVLKGYQFPFVIFKKDHFVIKKQIKDFNEFSRLRLGGK